MVGDADPVMGEEERVASRLAPFECSKAVRFVDWQPKIPAGKILRKDWRARL